MPFELFSDLALTQDFPWQKEQAILQKIHSLPLEQLEALGKYLDQLTA